MARVYGDLIRKKVKTIQQVPAGLRTDTIAYLNSLGLDENGNPIVQE
ncbi:ASCH domain-containing protein [Paenibacillus sp. 7124]|uniref:ASCH domain-containing protein n=1 Tax=Paenibacillus apii TaxID=1850370 RepID=A0A6M1PDG8_9BACL|nr:CD1375 family protein [Paenibacillus apii]NGM81277.1 ASCH domain-containing protein [Paenibacillus apii]